VVETLLDDDVVKDIIEGETASANLSFRRRRLLPSASGASQRLAGLLLQTLLLPVGAACLGVFAFQSYKATLEVADAGRRKAPPAAGSRHGGTAADSPQAAARREVDHWRW
jgi:hypothetical protein